jgi:hypothetical protein
LVPAARVAASTPPGRLHPAEVFRALGPVGARDPATILILDGGEFARAASNGAGDLWPGEPFCALSLRGLEATPEPASSGLFGVILQGFH